MPSLTTWTALALLAVALPATVQAAGHPGTTRPKPPRPAVQPTSPGRWQWPLSPAPKVVRGFVPPADPWSAGHRGVDLAARPGRPVHAAGPGRISYAGRIAGINAIAITHGALRTTYLPVRPALRRGRPVAAGARIGIVERFPAHCGPSPCLHWGLLRDGTYLDPLSLLHPRLRLLPYWPGTPGGD